MPPSTTKKRKHHELVNDDDDNDGEVGTNKRKRRTTRRRHTAADDDDNYDDNLNRHRSTTTIVRRGCDVSSDHRVDEIRTQVTTCPIPPSPVISLPYPGNVVDSTRRRNDVVVATVTKSTVDTASGKKANEITLPRCSRSTLVKNDHLPALNDTTSSIVDADISANDKSDAIIIRTDALCAEANNVINDRDDDFFVISSFRRHEKIQLYFLLLLLFSVVYFVLIYLVLVSVIYAQNHNHALAILQRDALHADTARAVKELTLQSNRLTDEKFQLMTDYDKLRVHMDDMSSRYAALQRKYDYRMSEPFLAPLFDEVHRLVQYSEFQRSMILNLTSVAESLYATLDVSREDVEELHIQSSRAVKAVAEACGESAIEKTSTNEELVRHMEMQLEKLEYEAMGAVRAVLEAGRSVRVREK
jgi:hypothetical protein